MNNTADQLAKILFQKNTADECAAADIEHLTETFPFFGPARLLLAATRKKDIRDDQVQKSLLYFSHPLLLYSFLHDYGRATIIPPAPQEKSSAQPVQTPAGQSIPDENKIASPGGHEPVFEPFHTVDYFASQGIKFKQEEKPADRFGQQLKSFTEWLKSMKRLPVPDADATTRHEAQVIKLADQSVTDSNVITEAMAEVWEKQGNHEKAIEIYSKLSLLNPSKSAYFAGKIEQLKQS